MKKWIRVALGLCSLVVLARMHAGGKPEGPVTTPNPEGANATILTLVSTIATSAWSPPSPDPTGLTYRTDTARILSSDSEVEEIPTLFTGSNIFETSPAGALGDAESVTATSNEPADVAWDSNASVLYVCDDDLDKILRINPQADGRLGTPDDTASTIYTTSNFGSNDPEGLDYDTADRSLWLSDGDTATIYHLQRGADGQFGGIDDVITSWDARKVGMRDPEGIDFDPITGHVFIVDRVNRLVAEATTAGSLVALFDISSSSILDGSGIAFAPASVGAGTNLYVSDRGVDNDVDPSENDGRIFEFALTTVSTNVAPVGANPGRQFNVEGDIVSLQIVAFDPNGDPITYGALDLPDGLAIDPATGVISGTVSFDAAASSPYSVQVTAGDGSLSDTEAFRWDVTAGNRPPVLGGMPDPSNVEGDVVSLQIPASDPDNDPLTYEATNLPSGLAIDPGTGLVSGTIAAGASSGSPYSVQIKVTDPENLSDTEIVRWSVTALPPNQPPVVQNPGDQTHTEGDTVILQIQATDPDNDPLTYGANNLPPDLSADPNTGLISGTVALGAASGSPYSVQVNANDGGSTDTESFLWNVLPAPNHPAAPTGLTITGDSQALRLDWANNIELDLAGYNVYRGDGVGPYTKLNAALLITSAYVDPAAPAGATSFYHVTAVNTAGNESGPASGSATRSKVVFRSASTHKDRDSATMNVARPLGVAPGDLLVAAVGVRGNATIAPPPGWTVVRSDLNGTTLRQEMFVKVATASEPASYLWTLSVSSPVVGAIAAYGGALVPAAAFGGQANSISESITAPGLTNPTPFSLEVGAFGTAENGQVSPASGMIEHAQESAVAGRSRITVELADDILEASGPMGARSATAKKAAPNIGQVLILNPAP